MKEKARGTLLGQFEDPEYEQSGNLPPLRFINRAIVGMINKMAIESPTVVDLYCGVGGFSLGFHVAGLPADVAVDKDETTISTYQNNFPDTEAKNLDLGGCTSEDILSGTEVTANDIDVVIGGPPCQGFSVMGKRDMDDERNDLLLSFADHILELEPDYFVMENVDGLLSGDARDYLDRFLKKIRDGGYDVQEPIQVLNAADYGIPQSRKRLFLLGFQTGLPEPDYPEIPDFDVDVEAAFRDLPSDLYNADLDGGEFKGQLSDPSEYMETLNSWPPTGNGIPEGITGLKPVNHKEEIRERYDKVQPGTYEEISRYYRLENSGKSTTLRAGSARDRGTHTAARPIHPIEPRVITVREAARLQSFPDWFQFHETKYYGMRQIGNSVPPLLAAHIGENLKPLLEN